MAVAGYERLEEDLSREWQEELQRRVTAFDEGRTKMIPAEDLWKEADLRFGTPL